MRSRRLLPVLAACALLGACRHADTRPSDPAGGAAPPHVASGSSTPEVMTDLIVHSHGYAFPNRTLTPGTILSGVTTAQVCSSGWAPADHVSSSLRRQVFASYHIPYSTHGWYELDHLVPVELGGGNSARNLWPQPLADVHRSGPNKAALENQLRGLVCHRRLGLATAQRAIALNWLTTWNRYEHIPLGETPENVSTTSSTGPGGSTPDGQRRHAGMTALCADGTMSFAAHQGAPCSHHGGVQNFLHHPRQSKDG